MLNGINKNSADYPVSKISNAHFKCMKRDGRKFGEQLI